MEFMGACSLLQWVPGVAQVRRRNQLPDGQQAIQGMMQA
jgi:hypothetical protein